MTTPTIVCYSTISTRGSICFLFFLFLRKYVSTLNKQLYSENVLFCCDGHLPTILFLCLVFGTIQKACLKPSRRIFAFYLQGRVFIAGNYTKRNFYMCLSL